MGLTRYLLRVFFRTHFKPINPRVAKRWEVTTSLAYFMVAWTTAGVACYYYMNSTKDHGDSPYAKGKAFTPYDVIRKFGSDEGNTIVRIKGWSKIEKEVVSRQQAIEESDKYR